MRRHSANLYLFFSNVVITLFATMRTFPIFYCNITRMNFAQSPLKFPPQSPPHIDFFVYPPSIVAVRSTAYSPPTQHYCPYRHRSSECRRSASLIAVFIQQGLCRGVLANRVILPPPNAIIVNPVIVAVSVVVDVPVIITKSTNARAVATIAAQGTGTGTGTGTVTHIVAAVTATAAAKVSVPLISTVREIETGTGTGTETGTGTNTGPVLGVGAGRFRPLLRCIGKRKGQTPTEMKATAAPMEGIICQSREAY